MIEMNNDIARRVRLEAATAEAHKDHFDYESYRTMDERLSSLRNQSQVKAAKKRSFPFFKILTIVSIVWYTVDNGLPDKEDILDTHRNVASVIKAVSQEESILSGETAKVTIEIGGKTFQQDVSIEDLQAAQTLSNSMKTQ